MNEEEFKLNIGSLTEEQNEQLDEMLKKAARRSANRKGRNMSDSQARKIGIIVTAISMIVVMFTLYLLFLGGTSNGTCVKANRVSGKYYNSFTYSVEGVEYHVTYNCNKHNKTQIGDARKIHYLPAAPAVTFDPNLLILSLMSAAIGALFIAAGRGSSKQE